MKTSPNSSNSDHEKKILEIRQGLLLQVQHNQRPVWLKWLLKPYILVILGIIMLFVLYAALLIGMGILIDHHG